MSINKFGSLGYNSKSAVTKKDLDSKFINLTNNLQLKVNKSGDTLSGNLDMTAHKITNLADPISDNDASNKKYVKSEIKDESIITKLYIDTLLHSKLDKNDDEVCNKKYLDSRIKQESTLTKLYIDGLFTNFENRLNLLDTFITLTTQKDDIAADKLFDIGSVIKNLLRKTNINIVEFSKSFNYVEKMYEKYIEIFDDKTNENIPDVLKTCILYTDLKVAIIKVIEALPKNIFIELKIELKNEDLLSTPAEKTLRKRYRRFINGMSKIVDPNRSNEVLELLVQKNLLLIDLGYVCFIESLLKSLLDES